MSLLINTFCFLLRLSTNANSTSSNLREPTCMQGIITVVRGSVTCPTIARDSPAFLN